LHDREFFRAISDILDSNGRCVTSVNDALVILYGHPYPALIKYRPVLLNKGVNPGMKSVVEMGQVQMLAEACTVKSFIER
jgi:hypothetical protein